jgi:hypothetical protein
MALDSRGNLYAVGFTYSPDFPVTTAGAAGTSFVLKINGRSLARGQPAVIWSRRFGGHGGDAFLSVAAGMPGSLFVAGRSGSKDFQTTRTAIHRRLRGDNDSILMQFRASDGQPQFASFLGGNRQHVSWYNDEATGVFADVRGDVYVTGCSIDDQLPVTPGAVQPHRKENSDAFVLRMKFPVLNSERSITAPARSR